GRPELTVEQVLAWADAYHKTHGRWPHAGIRQRIPGASGATWATIQKLLQNGSRGLPPGMTLRRILVMYRGPDARNGPPRLTVEQILRWADAYQQEHGRWPGTQSGTVAGSASETWLQISVALRLGRRGLPGGTSLGRLLAERRGVRNPACLPTLTIE